MYIAPPLPEALLLVKLESTIFKAAFVNIAPPLPEATLLVKLLPLNSTLLETELIKATAPPLPEAVFSSKILLSITKLLLIV